MNNVQNTAALLSAKHNGTELRIKEDQQIVEKVDKKAHESSTVIRNTAQNICEVLNKKKPQRKTPELDDIFDLPENATVREYSGKGILGLLREDD